MISRTRIKMPKTTASVICEPPLCRGQALGYSKDIAAEHRARYTSDSSQNRGDKRL